MQKYYALVPTLEFVDVNFRGFLSCITTAVELAAADYDLLSTRTRWETSHFFVKALLTNHCQLAHNAVRSIPYIVAQYVP